MPPFDKEGCSKHEEIQSLINRWIESSRDESVSIRSKVESIETKIDGIVKAWHAFSVLLDIIKWTAGVAGGALAAYEVYKQV